VSAAATPRRPRRAPLPPPQPSALSYVSRYLMTQKEERLDPAPTFRPDVRRVCPSHPHGRRRVNTRERGTLPPLLLFFLFRLHNAHRHFFAFVDIAASTWCLPSLGPRPPFVVARRSRRGWRKDIRSAEHIGRWKAAEPAFVRRGVPAV
jgi:hypothetical protein